MSCCMLLRSGAFDTADECIAHYNKVRRTVHIQADRLAWVVTSPRTIAESPTQLRCAGDQQLDGRTRGSETDTESWDWCVTGSSRLFVPGAGEQRQGPDHGVPAQVRAALRTDVEGGKQQRMCSTTLHVRQTERWTGSHLMNPLIFVSSCPACPRPGVWRAAWAPSVGRRQLSASCCQSSRRCCCMACR